MKNIYIFITLLLMLNSVQAQNLVCHYKFDNNPNDEISQQNNGTIIGGVTPTANRFGVNCTAYEFDGTGYIEIPNNQKLKGLTTSLSITVWAKLSTNSPDNWFSICCKANSKTEFYDSPQFRFQLNDKQVSLSTYNTNEWTQSFNKDEWYFLAITVSNTNQKVYINSKLVLNKQLDEKIEENTQNLLIGNDMPGKEEFFQGAMDDLRIYSSELSAQEIKKLYKDKSDKNIQAKCDSTPNYDTIPVTINCDDIVKSGGNEISIKKMNLGKNFGKFKLHYNMYNIPDKLTIYSEADNSIIYQTSDFVSGIYDDEITYSGTQNIIIKVEGNQQKRTKWDYKITCL